MASDRDTLEYLLLSARIDAKTTDETVDDILDAGWRPPARVIADPSELSALPALSVVINTHTGAAWQRTNHLSWISKNGLLDSRDLFRAPGHLVLTHVPTEEATDGQ